VPLTNGSRIGPFEILAPLGAGGMGEVYRARDTRLNRDVALKVLPQAFEADPDRAARFEREAQAVAALSHPNILAIHDFGTSDGVTYAVMELLDGATLRERLQSGPLPLRRAIGYAVQFARGLAAAHDRGIVHRDLKPENLFITSDERCKILDFGLARREIAPVTGDETYAAPRATDPGTVMGTVGYMAPEQVRGEAGDQRSDLFAFGCVLYEMLTGRRAFHRETPAETMTAILRDDPPSLESDPRALPPALDRIVAHCLEKKADRRFRSAHDLAFALEALSGSATQPAALPPRQFRSSRRIALAATGFIAVVALAGIAYDTGRAHARPPDAVSFKRLTFSPGVINHGRFAPDGTTVIYSAGTDPQTTQLFMTRLDTVGASRLQIPDAALLAVSPSAELAIAEHARDIPPALAPVGTLARAPLLGGAPRAVTPDATFADWNPVTGELAAVVTGTRVRLESPIGTVRYETDGAIGWPRFSRDGRRIAFIDWPVKNDDRGVVRVLEPDGTSHVISRQWEGVRGVTWSPDDKEVWYSASANGEQFTMYASTLDGQDRLLLKTPIGLVIDDVRSDGKALAFEFERSIDVGVGSREDAAERDASWLELSFARDISPDGRRIVYSYAGQGSGANYTVFLRDLDQSDAVRIGEGQAQQFSPDGRYVLSVLHGPPATVELLPTGTGQPVTVPTNGLDVSIARWLADGTHLVLIAAEPGHGRRAYLADLHGAIRPISPENIGVEPNMLPVAGDGRVVLSAKGQYRIYGPDGRVSPIPGLRPEDIPIAWIDRDRALLTASRTDYSRIARLDLASGRSEPWITLRPAKPSLLRRRPSMAFSPDGRLYAANYQQITTELFLVEGLR
jgi:serine/threonine protein kinase/Tol biopolymer transport system component